MNSPDAVGQAIRTRLNLFTAEWFANTRDGTPWRTDVLGKVPAGVYDAVLKARILGTPGVQQITSYTSSLDRNKRALTITATVQTIYGSTTISGAF